MLISMDKQYRTKNGEEVRILCVDRKHNIYPILGLIVRSDSYEDTQSYTDNGQYYNDRTSNHDLVEVNEYDDFEIDEPVMVRMKGGANWYKRHFAGVDNGKPMAWDNIKTSWISNTTCVWDYCRRPTKEELNS